jgi:hypothetical protein
MVFGIIHISGSSFAATPNDNQQRGEDSADSDSLSMRRICWRVNNWWITTTTTNIGGWRQNWTFLLSSSAADYPSIHPVKRPAVAAV